MFQGKVPRNGQEDDITFACFLNVKEFDGNVTIFFRGHFGTGTAFTAKDTQFAHGKVACFEALTHFLADGTRRTDNTHGQVHGHAVGRWSGPQRCRGSMTKVTRKAQGSDIRGRHATGGGGGLSRRGSDKRSRSKGVGRRGDCNGSG